MSSGSKILGFIGVLGVMASSLAFVLFTGKEVPTVGRVAPVFAAAPERVELRALKQDQTLGDLLAGVLDANDQYSFVLALRERANPRRLRPGTEVAFRRLTAAPSELRAVDITLDADVTVRMTPSLGGWNSQLITTPVVTDTVWASGEIESNLWQSVVSNDDLSRVDSRDRNKLVLSLEDQFQWRVDFVRGSGLGTSTDFPSNGRCARTGPCA